MSFFIKLPAFAQGGRIPAIYTCQGKNISPEVIWGDMPEGSKSFALVCDDPDASSGTWVHWVIFNIPATEKGLKQNIPALPRLPDGSLQGRNDSRKLGYDGPAPPPGSIHRYFFRLYALDGMLSAQPGIAKQELLRIMQNHILDKAEYYGTFSR